MRSFVIKIDGYSVLVVENITVLQACEKLEINVPKFCFHDQLLIAGNCRMCLVEIFKVPKPVASCSIPVAFGMQIFTKSPLVRKARENVLEFLLINHPLDCPICDQGGECDLQDQSLVYGSDKSRFFFIIKKTNSIISWGPLISTVITRCILCTRCSRFLSQKVGFSFLGAAGRGISAEISFFFEKKSKPIFSGNLVNLCPVGFFSQKPYFFY